MMMDWLWELAFNCFGWILLSPLLRIWNHLWNISVNRLFWLQKYVVILRGRVTCVRMQRFCGLMPKISEKVWKKALSALALTILICCKFTGEFTQREHLWLTYLFRYIIVVHVIWTCVNPWETCLYFSLLKMILIVLGIFVN